MTTTMENGVIISLCGVSCRRDGKDVLHDVNLDIRQGDFVAITGPNGGGKTTLLRIVLKLLKPSHGSVKYLRTDEEVKELSIGYLPQKNMIDSRFPITVEEVVASGLIGENSTKEEKIRLTAETLRMMGLEAHARKNIGALSGGQLQRALLGRAIISRPKVLVLDEPLSYVDKPFEHYIYSLVKELSATTTILLVSHEMTAISEMANRHLFVDHSVIEEQGSVCK